jgi:hypothetical protein
MFQLNIEEKDKLVTKCDQFKPLKHSTTLQPGEQGLRACLQESVCPPTWHIQIFMVST